MADLATKVAAEDASLDGLIAWGGDVVPWLVPALHSLRALMEGRLYEAGRHLPMLGATSTRQDLTEALRRVRRAWAAGVRWRHSGTSDSRSVVEAATKEGASCALESMELVATFRVAAGVG